MPKYRVGESDSEASSSIKQEAELSEDEPLLNILSIRHSWKNQQNFNTQNVHKEFPRGNSQLHYSEQETEAREKEICLCYTTRLLGDWQRWKTCFSL